MKAIVLLSGGMDSLVTTAIAQQEGFELAAMHVNYGQRTMQQELQAFRAICAHYNIQHQLEVNAHFLVTLLSIYPFKIAKSRVYLSAKEVYWQKKKLKSDENRNT